MAVGQLFDGPWRRGGGEIRLALLSSFTGRPIEGDKRAEGAIPEAEGWVEWAAIVAGVFMLPGTVWADAGALIKTAPAATFPLHRWPSLRRLFLCHCVPFAAVSRSRSALLHAGAQTIGSSSCRRFPLCNNNSAPFTDPTTASHDTSAFASASPASPLPARWSLTNRIFNLGRSVYNAPPRLPASRLWNPVNSSPRTLAVEYTRTTTAASTTTRDHEPNVPVQRPQSATRDEYPLLTLPERRQSRQSPAPSSLVVERSTGGNSSRTSFGLRRDRSSLPIEPQPPTPGPAMPVQQDATADAQDSAPIPGPRLDDVEVGVTLKPSLTRVSLPSRPTSMHSRIGTAEGDGDDASEFPWGPSHPCFPHPNPHVPVNSELYESTRIIRIKRDWMVKGDLAPTFANLYPEILDPLISEEDFRKIVQKINDTLVDAFDPFSFRAWLDSIMGVATFWLWDDAGLTKVKRQLAELEKWIETWNRQHGEKEGVRIIPLRRTGYLTLDIAIPDPRLGPDNGTSSRPNTQQDDLENIASQQHSGYDAYPVTPTLQVNPPPVATGS